MAIGKQSPVAILKLTKQEIEMKIVNMYGDNINGCFQFDHNGHTISASSVMNRNRVEVVWWKISGGRECHPANTIQGAIEAINELPLD